MKRLKQLRKERKITAKQLAEELHVSESTISLYENGKREPEFKILLNIATYFNVSVDYLLGIDTLNPSTKSESIPENCIMLRGRDGTVIEGELTDEQIELIKLMIEQRNKK